eukprot:TRINITY_DN3496_c0_g1_i1.p2 TRINITY_DN3496_c0_g1~~TRINITY_DN3496_c0_g1_i1.p2  ORF type:complete len:262 (+),score=70.83 TRINITY_DN3496_c0_g1_i1:64-849(+)
MPAKKKKDKKKGKGGGGGGGGGGPGAAAHDVPDEAPEVMDDADVLDVGDSRYPPGMMHADPCMPPPPPPLFNAFARLEGEEGRRYPVKQDSGKYVTFTQFRTESDLHQIIAMMRRELSEPYPIFTYRFFINKYPDLCWLCLLKDKEDPEFEEIIGAIASKAAYKSRTNFRIRGYIAMLAVNQEYRGNGLGSRLVELVIETMRLKGCTEVVLEALLKNKAALALYEGLGFTREKRLDKYYLDGTDAFRLKLWLGPPDPVLRF